MSTKASIRHQDKDGELPGWQLYSDLFEPDDVVYLEIEGVQADITMIDSNWRNAPGTVRLRLPVTTAQQLGLVPPGWERDGSWTRE